MKTNNSVRHFLVASLLSTLALSTSLNFSHTFSDDRALSTHGHSLSPRSLTPRHPSEYSRSFRRVVHNKSHYHIKNQRYLQNHNVYSRKLHTLHGHGRSHRRHSRLHNLLKRRLRLSKRRHFIKEKFYTPRMRKAFVRKRAHKLGHKILFQKRQVRGAFGYGRRAKRGGSGSLDVMINV